MILFFCKVRCSCRFQDAGRAAGQPGNGNLLLLGRNESVIEEIAAAQREELEEGIAGLKEEAERVAEEA